MPTALRVHNLWKSYAAGVIGCSVRVWALRACSFDLSLGERVAVVGARGAGKSTLLRCIAGAHRVDAGRIEVALPIRCWSTNHTTLSEERARSAAPMLLLFDDDVECGLLRRVDGTLLVAARDVASVHGLVDRILLLREGRLSPMTRVAARRVAERVVR